MGESRRKFFAVIKQIMLFGAQSATTTPLVNFLVFSPSYTKSTSGNELFKQQKLSTGRTLSVDHQHAVIIRASGRCKVKGLPLYNIFQDTNSCQNSRHLSGHCTLVDPVITTKVYKNSQLPQKRTNLVLKTHEINI